ncbi:kelch repeat-containing protein [Leptospira venezuelensis]|uniref:Kelch repeat-containing protein n=1 Tax=Leptospira venezuelensis TaxID=1958811 RepID=UPI000A3BA432|nr:kelch repeat-containing protein [Leptospira venezuelensis]
MNLKENTSYSIIKVIERKLTEIFFFSFLFCSFLSCDQTPLESGSELSSLKVQGWAISNLTSNSATLSWSCSTIAKGFVSYGPSTGTENIAVSLVDGRKHLVELKNLSGNTNIKFQVVCEHDTGMAMSGMQSFESQPDLSQILKRGIIVVGGLGDSLAAVAQIDLYDPVTDLWYEKITNIPTPRAYANIVSLNNKIYVIGGMDTSLTTLLTTVEEYDPFANSWKTLSSMPQALVGSSIASVGSSIYLLGGTIGVAMSAPPANKVYKFTPGIGASGTWQMISSSSPILARSDMNACSIDGIIFYSTGRNYSGNVQNTGDAYIPSSNTTTGAESAFNLSKFGAGSACYRPLPSDLNPSDFPAVVTVGGSTLNNVNEPPNAILPSTEFEIYTIGSNKSITTGSVMPNPVYAPSVEFSYDTRSVYVFGGSKTVYVPLDLVYSISMGSTTGTWTARNSMPVARYGHRSVILSR